MNFKDVKSLVIPEGEVSIIARGAEILWRKQKYKCEVEYLESTGTQWLDMGHKPTTNTRIVCEALFNSWNGASANYIFGVFNSPNNYGLNLGSARTRFNVPWGTHTGIELNGLVPQLNVRYSFDISKSGYYINGIAYGNLSTESVSSDKTLYLFWSNGTTALAMKGRMYYCKAWESGVLVRDFIPVLDWNDRPCMYDRVTDELFYNQGTGEFIAGRQIHPVEWLESTGTQWINTNYAFKDDFSWEIDFEGIEPGNTIFGGRTATARTAVLYQYTVTNTTTCPIGSHNGSTTPFQLGNLSNGRHTVKMTVASNKGSVWVDGVQKHNNIEFAGAYISGTAQAIFADNFGGGDIREYASSKVFGVKMGQGANLVRDYIPAHDENGVGFMFDRVTHTIFDNAGTGEFLYGEVT